MAPAWPDIWFYVPSVTLVNEAPAAIEGYWPWVLDVIERAPAPFRFGNGKGNRRLGPYNWTIQTFLYLRAAGLPCRLTAQLPEAGIIVAHSDFLPPLARPSRWQFFLEIKPDRALQCRYANFAIVQNGHDPIRQGMAASLIASAVVHNWPQAGLVPRNSARRDRFENAHFMGNADQFLPDTDALVRRLREIDMVWTMPPRQQWHDYSEVDVVVAVRPACPPQAVTSAFLPFYSMDRKPAAKLQNAWRAGVPAVLSRDSAYLDVRRSDLDYLEATTVDDIVRNLVRLKSDPTLRAAMVDHGSRRADEFTPARLVAAWMALLDEQVLPGYHAWTRSAVRRGFHHLARRVIALRG